MIVAAAIRIKGVVWTLPRPARHGHIIYAYVCVNGDDSFVNAETKRDDQGFINDKGNFMNRAEAAEHFLACGQPYSDRCDIKTLKKCKILFSEDVW